MGRKALTTDQLRAGCNNWCVNVTAEETADMAKAMGVTVYTHMLHINKVFQAYPGGRTILRPALKRYVERAHRSQVEVNTFIEVKWFKRRPQ